MKPKDALEQIEATLEIMKTKDITSVHKLATALFRPADVLALIDQQLSIEVKTKITEILSLAELATILSKIEEMKQLIGILKAKLVAPVLQKRFLGVSGVIHLPAYIKAREKYNAWSKQLDKLESDILEAPEYNKKLHEPWKRGKYKDHLHARLTENLRVLYFIDREKNVAVFVNILTKNELEKA